MSDADELVTAYILDQYRKSTLNIGHLSTCPDVRVEDPDYTDGSYGCDTGCEYVTFDAVITCPHGEREEFEYGEFGDLAGIISWLQDEQAKRA